MSNTSQPLTEIYHLRIAGDHPVNPVDRLTGSLMGEIYRMKQLHNKVCLQATEMQKEHGLESIEYMAATAHGGAIKKKLLEMSRTLRLQEVDVAAFSAYVQVLKRRTMQIRINAEERSLPASLHAITLQDRIGYARQYGEDLRRQLLGIRQMEAGADQDLALAQWYADRVYRELAYFLNLSPEALMSAGLVHEVAEVHVQSLHELIQYE